MIRPNILSRIFALNDGSPEGCRVLCADPPWPFGDALPGLGRGAKKHYDLMDVDDICHFQLPVIADDAYLFLWRVSAMVEEAYQVCRAWGFVPKTEVVWRKLTSTGKKEHFGMGWHLRGSHETCIVAVRGNPKPLVRNIRTTFEAPTNRQHSAKPETFYTDIVEKISHGPYVELFARRTRPGWSTLGNEVLDVRTA